MNSLLRAADIDDFMQNSRKKNTRIPEKAESIKESNNQENNYRISQTAINTKNDPRLNYIMESGHNANVENVKYLKTMIANDINIKMQNYKINSPPDRTIITYINEQINKKSNFYYDFGIEENVIPLKVLIQILYEQIEECCVNSAIMGHGHHKFNKPDGPPSFDPGMPFSNQPNKTHELEYLIKTWEEAKQTDMKKINLEQEDLQLKNQNFENQLKRKNALINRLFSDRSLFVKSFDKLTGVLTRSYQFFMRYLSDIKDVYVKEILKIQLPSSFISNDQAQECAEKLTKEICSLTKFQFWAKDYEKTDDLKFFNDVEYFKRVENEKKEYNEIFAKDFEHTNKNFQEVLEGIDKSKDAINDLREKNKLLMSELSTKSQKIDKNDEYLDKRLGNKDREILELKDIIINKDKVIKEYENSGKELKKTLLKLDTLENLDFFVDQKKADEMDSDFVDALRIVNDLILTGGKNVTENQLQRIEKNNPRMKYILRGIKNNDNSIIDKIQNVNFTLRDFQKYKKDMLEELATLYDILSFLTEGSKPLKFSEEFLKDNRTFFNSKLNDCYKKIENIKKVTLQDFTVNSTKSNQKNDKSIKTDKKRTNNSDKGQTNDGQVKFIDTLELQKDSYRTFAESNDTDDSVLKDYGNHDKKRNNSSFNPNRLKTTTLTSHDLNYSMEHPVDQIKNENQLLKLQVETLNIETYALKEKLDSFNWAKSQSLARNQKGNKDSTFSNSRSPIATRSNTTTLNPKINRNNNKKNTKPKDTQFMNSTTLSSPDKINQTGCNLANTLNGTNATQDSSNDLLMMIHVQSTTLETLLTSLLN